MKDGRGRLLDSASKVRGARLAPQPLDQGIERKDFLPGVLAEGPNRDAALLLLPLADDEEGGDVGEAVLADLVIDLLVPEVERDSQAGLLQALGDAAGIIVALGNDRRDHRLDRRQPEREAAGMMLDQDSDEALERADDRPMEHHRNVLLAILADVGGAEQPRHDIVELKRAALPRPPDRVGQVEFELGAVEGALARQFLPSIFGTVAAGEVDRVAQVLLGPVPGLVRAVPLFGTKRELDRIIGEAEILVD